MHPVSWFLWKGETFFSGILSRIFWAPTSAAVIVEEDGRLLAVDRGEYLMLPGGIVEKGESFSEAAKREVEEETGIIIKVDERLEERTREKMGVEVVFRADVREGNLDGSWEGDPVWIDIAEAVDRNWRFDRDISRYVDTG